MFVFVSYVDCYVTNSNWFKFVLPLFVFFLRNKICHILYKFRGIDFSFLRVLRRRGR